MLLKANLQYEFENKKVIPCFSMSGMPATFEADLNELYKIHKIQMTKPTMLDVSKVTYYISIKLKFHVMEIE